MDHYFLTLINGGAPICTSQRLRLKFDKLLSNLAFSFNLRRYTKVEEGNKAAREAKKDANGKGREASAPLFKRMEQEYKVQPRPLPLEILRRPINLRLEHAILTPLLSLATCQLVT